jgi:hypothetical protein
MVDIPALRKVTEHALSLPQLSSGDWQDLLVDEGSAPDAWAQDEWLTLPDDVGQVTLTEQGVVDQDGKTCGTAACIAGWTVMLLAPNGTTLLGYDMTLPDGTWCNVEDWAARRLGLDSVDKNALFAAWNGPDAIRLVTEAIIATAEANED